MTPYASITAPLLEQGKKLPKSKKVFDNSKVTDHHAIIPTNVPPQTVAMSLDEKHVYNLIAVRFVAAFYPDCVFSTTTVMADIADFEFKATGKQILTPGWRELYKNAKDDADKADGDDNDLMPAFAEGESGQHRLLR